MGKVNWDKGTRFCLWCGKPFEPNSPNHVYCSDKCRKKGVANLKKTEKEYNLSPNMLRIMEIVKDGPEYGIKVAKEGL